MPLFKSFRSKSSLKSSASVLSENDATSDFGPRSPSTNTFASKKNSEFGSMGRANKHHGGNQMTSSPSSASVRTSQSVALQSQQPNMMDAVSGGRPPASTDAGPRPSELFAGKGVQWDSVKLAGPGSSPAVQTRSTTNNTEDLQNFLKQYVLRRYRKDLSPNTDFCLYVLPSLDAVSGSPLLSLRSPCPVRKRRRTCRSSLSCRKIAR